MNSIITTLMCSFICSSSIEDFQKSLYGQEYGNPAYDALLNDKSLNLQVDYEMVDNFIKSSAAKSTSSFSPINSTINIAFQMAAGRVNQEHLKNAGKKYLENLEAALKKFGNKTSSLCFYNKAILPLDSECPSELPLNTKFYFYDSKDPKNHQQIQTEISELEDENVYKLNLFKIKDSDLKAGAPIFATIMHLSNKWSAEEKFKCRLGNIHYTGGKKLTDTFMERGLNNKCRYKNVLDSSCEFEMYAFRFEYSHKYAIYLIPSKKHVDLSLVWDKFNENFKDYSLSSLIFNEMSSTHTFGLKIPLIHDFQADIYLSELYKEVFSKYNVANLNSKSMAYLNLDQRGIKIMAVNNSLIPESEEPQPAAFLHFKPYIMLIVDIELDRILFAFKDIGSQDKKN